MKAAATIDPGKLAKTFSPQFVSETSRRPSKWTTGQMSSEDDERLLAASRIQHDFTRLSVVEPTRATACPLSSTPTRCPFGGACHTCPAKVQAKLTIGDPGDKYEQEADRVADQVMQMPTPPVQKQAEPQHGQAGCLRPQGRQDAFAPRAAEEQSTHANPPANSLTDGGQPLSQTERQFFEARFGHDFSHVRLHAGAEAAAFNDGLISRAFTYGQHIWLGEQRGSAHPRLLAHELAHTIQQGAAPPLETPASGSPLGRLHNHAPAIQRSVQETGVRSPESVLLRIARTLAKTALQPIPLQLYALGHEFHPGKGVDDPRNAFVYTCKGGWIDLGHFFFTAAGASTRVGADATWAKALLTEEEQQQERRKYERMPPPEREKYFGRSWKEATPEQQARRGSAWSAYTIEDLPSDRFGFEFGLSLRPLVNVLAKMMEFFRRWGAVDASRDKGRLKKMMAETLGTVDPEKLPRQHTRTAPVLLASARGLCGDR